MLGAVVSVEVCKSDGLWVLYGGRAKLKVQRVRLQSRVELPLRFESPLGFAWKLVRFHCTAHGTIEESFGRGLH